MTEDFTIASEWEASFAPDERKLIKEAQALRVRGFEEEIEGDLTLGEEIKKLYTTLSADKKYIGKIDRWVLLHAISGSGIATAHAVENPPFLDIDEKVTAFIKSHRIGKNIPESSQSGIVRA